MDAPHIALADVRKSFGSNNVLNGIDLQVPRGHSMVVIGGSGTGKSVMIKSILGLVRADSGS
ncbi:MAG TPA: ATP-binding cassette domain-containing protein, partial [Aestuariivirgaceae bacterium]|nr:ATP-binding cassette domain-containing protein [Aestuariivirgaceae bacterium]